MNEVIINYPYEWPYKWATGCSFTLLNGVISPYIPISDRGPPCASHQNTSFLKLVFFFLRVDFCAGRNPANHPGWRSTLQQLQVSNTDNGAFQIYDMQYRYGQGRYMLLKKSINHYHQRKTSKFFEFCKK